MELHPLPPISDFSDFSALYLNERGRYVEPSAENANLSDARPIVLEALPDYLVRRVVLPENVTDVFVWVHGWRNTPVTAIKASQRLFQGLRSEHQRRPDKYPGLAPFVPAFLVVCWPSMSEPLPAGFNRVRDRTRAMTDKGEAEFFLASLLGYLESENKRDARRVLRSRGGFYVHCLGHSFGGRFLAAAIRAAANPESPKTLSLASASSWEVTKVLSAQPAGGSAFTVDSLTVFQMAAPRVGFGRELTLLLETAPLNGPIVLTHSRHDRASCVWHRFAEGEPAIGCSGALEPKGAIRSIKFGALEYSYSLEDLATSIVNVNADGAFTHAGFRPEGAHSDFYYEESAHLVLSVANCAHLRGPTMPNIRE